MRVRVAFDTLAYANRLTLRLGSIVVGSVSILTIVLSLLRVVH